MSSPLLEYEVVSMSKLATTSYVAGFFLDGLVIFALSKMLFILFQFTFLTFSI